VDGAGAVVGVRETVEEAVEGSGRGRRRWCRCDGAGGASGEIGQPDGGGARFRPTLSAHSDGHCNIPQRHCRGG